MPYLTPPSTYVVHSIYVEVRLGSIHNRLPTWILAQEYTVLLREYILVIRLLLEDLLKTGRYRLDNSCGVGAARGRVLAKRHNALPKRV
jgi:hypothetical protein